MNSISKIFKEQIKKTEREYFKNNEWDKWRLKFHIIPPIGWLNDPNGLSYFNGFYNIFFQYSPFEVNGGLKFWGHYKSNNLIDYKYEGVAIYPDERFDCHGVYSGSAFIEDDNLYLYYTGNVKLLGKHDYINSGRESNTLLITTKDAVNFSEKICLMEMKDFPHFITNHIRDPKVWKKDNIYYMVQGVRKNTKPNMGAVLIFSSNDKINWKYLNCIDSDKEFGYMWECPDLFEINGQNILITCPQGVEQKENVYENIYLSGYFLINSDYRNGDIKVSDFTILDRGFDFYAPQTFLDENGNRVLIGWMGVPDTEEIHKNLTVKYGWQHCLTIPRELTLKNKKLFQNPHRNLDKLRNGIIFKKEYNENEFSSNLIYDNIDSYEVLINLGNLNNGMDFKFIISEGLCGKYENGKFILEFINDIGGGRKKRSCDLECLNNLRIFVDTSAVEIFINDGEAVFSTRYYPNNNSFKVCGNMHIEIYKLDGFKIDYNI